MDTEIYLENTFHLKNMYQFRNYRRQEGKGRSEVSSMLPAQLIKQQQTGALSVK